jgi:signal transduction histidine kinase
MLMGKDILSFKISTGLKSLIGKELITDELIAIFELVKNAFDAHAKNVKIYFENNKGKDPKVIIVDDGKGMDLTDIKEKWLFVAYSAKSDGSEDENELNDYRDKLKSKRGFAGAKGVGRFSCDRLGSKLNLITIKDKLDAKIENISIEWDDFEENNKNEFVDIGVEHNVLESHNYDIEHGTILEIGGLRDEWSRTRLIKLKDSLEKLINPNQQEDPFNIEIIASDELTEDVGKPEHKKVNGFIKNKIFEVLKIKTTKINVSIESNNITTILEDRGKLVYKVTEKSPYSIENISIELFYLNQAAKSNFTKIMGMQPVRYGSVFMYKNGFRIYPFGEPGEDPLKLDIRKTQGHSRYLGTRELIGRIEITDFQDNFVETTSRDGGFIKSSSYEELVEVFYEVLKKLEMYVVRIIKWGEPYRIEPNDEHKQPALNPEDVTAEITEIIKKMSLTKDVISVEYDKDFIEIIEERQSDSVTKVISDITVRALETSNDKGLHKGIEKLGKKFNELLSERNEIEQENEVTRLELKRKTEELDSVESRNLFLTSVASVNVKEVASLQHHIDHGTVKISTSLDRLREAIQKGAPKEELFKFIEKISLENEKISTIARFVTKANFNTTSKTITRDLVQFINEYIQNVYLHYEDLKINNQILNIDLQVNPGVSFQYKFRPLEIILIIDNLLSNSYKANAKNVRITWEEIDPTTIRLRYQDDGRGIAENIIDKIFEFGFTTTDGSGLGLYHVKQLIEGMGGSIIVTRGVAKGAEFIVEVRHGD